MKTLILIISLSILPLIAMSYNDPTVENAVQSEIVYPQNLKANNVEGDVLVQFTVAKDGSVSIDQINSSDVSLKDYVVGKLGQMFFGKSDEAKQYNMKFSFKLL
jgi:hypothetical protein